jgi:hypothetical protein
MSDFAKELAKHDVALKQLEEEEHKKKEFLKQKVVELRKKVLLNPSLQEILDDYLATMKKELNEKEEQYEAMMNISSYVDLLYKNKELTKEQLEQGIHQQKDLLAKMASLKEEINALKKFIST